MAYLRFYVIVKEGYEETFYDGNGGFVHDVLSAGRYQSLAKAREVLGRDGLSGKLVNGEHLFAEELQVSTCSVGRHYLAYRSKDGELVTV